MMRAAQSIGLGIVLPHEQAPNEYVTPDLSFNFHYFAIRKMHFLMRAKAVTIFPGGFGTLDEMFETLTLIQTGRMKRVPFLLFGREFWDKVINWQALAEAGTISPEDLELISFVETADEAVAIIDNWDCASCARSISSRPRWNVSLAASAASTGGISVFALAVTCGATSTTRVGCTGTGLARLWA
jgi:uncharacterized protein (TIGR00730 family)